MKNNGSVRPFPLIIAILGAALVLLSAGLLLGSVRAERQAAEELPALAARISAAFPARSTAMPEECAPGAMPALELDGTDYIALLQIPGRTEELPVRSTWDKKAVRRVPCRLSGTAADCDLVIGGTDSAGQFDFVPLIGLGERVCLTNTAGQQISYEVTDILRRKSAEVPSGGDLTLFARRATASEYVFVLCTACGTEGSAP